MTTDTRIKVGLSEETLRLVDQHRGLVPRSTWLRHIIEERVAVGRSVGMYPTVETPPDDPACPLGWKRRPGTARCFNCNRSMSRHAQTVLVEF
jgi:hypothetical protein